MPEPLNYARPGHRPPRPPWRSTAMLLLPAAGCAVVALVTADIRMRHTPPGQIAVTALLAIVALGLCAGITARCVSRDTDLPVDAAVFVLVGVAVLVVMATSALWLIARSMR